MNVKLSNNVKSVGNVGVNSHWNGFVYVVQQNRGTCIHNSQLLATMPELSSVHFWAVTGQTFASALLHPSCVSARKPLELPRPYWILRPTTLDASSSCNGNIVYPIMLKDPQPIDKRRKKQSLRSTRAQHFNSLVCQNKHFVMFRIKALQSKHSKSRFNRLFAVVEFFSFLIVLKLNFEKIFDGSKHSL